MPFVVVRVFQWRVGMKMNSDGVDLPELVTITLGRNAFRFDSNCSVSSLTLRSLFLGLY